MDVRFEGSPTRQPDQQDVWMLIIQMMSHTSHEEFAGFVQDTYAMRTENQQHYQVVKTTARLLAAESTIAPIKKRAIVLSITLQALEDAEAGRLTIRIKPNSPK